MRRERVALRGALVSIIAIVLLGGCAPRTHAPKTWLPSAQEALSDPYGGWIRLKLVPGTPGGGKADAVADADQSWEFSAADQSPDRVSMIEGEFLGLDADSVFVLFGSDSVCAVHRANVVRAEVAFFDPQTGIVQGAAVFGGLVSFSHGYFAGLTMPMWLLGGTVAATTQANYAIKNLKKEDWEKLRPFARFPQGPPPGLRDLHLHMRPAPGAPPPRNE